MENGSRRLWMEKEIFPSDGKKEFTIDGKGNFLLNDPFDGKEDLLWMEKEIVLLKNPSGGKEDLL